MADVAHSTLTGADLHEPKGADTATADQIYVSDGAGSGTWTSLSSLQIPGVWKLISTSTPSSASNVGITGFNSSLYSDYKIVLEDLKPSSSSNDGLAIRLSTNGGASYLSGGSDYWFCYYATSSSDSFVSNQTSSGSFIGVYTGSSLDTTLGFFGEVSLIKPSISTQTTVRFTGTTKTSGGNLTGVFGHGGCKTTQDTDGIQFYYRTGNIASGTIRFYGLTI